MSIVRTLLIVAAFAAVANADIKVCGPPPGAAGEACDDLTEAFFTANGFNYPTITEVTENTVAFAGEPGTADLTFDYLLDTGDFEFCFGFCLTNDVPAGLLAPIMAGGASYTDRQAFAESCILQHGYEVFNDSATSPGTAGSTVVITGVPVPSNVIFFLLPDNRVSEFAANPGNFFAPDGTNSAEPGPLFSLSEANPGEFDQLVLYNDGASTLFSWEDKQRGPGSPEGTSDEDFSDLAFKLDAVLIPDVVNPCELVCKAKFSAYGDFESPADYQGHSDEFESDTNCACLTFDTK